MKNWGIFFGGVGTGIVLTILVLYLIGTHYANQTPVVNKNPNQLEVGVTNFEQVGDAINEKSVKVTRVIDANTALARGEGAKDYKGEPYYNGHTYLLRNNEGKYYYDNEIIKRPSGKKFLQTGIYRYREYNNFNTIPVIELK